MCSLSTEAKVKLGLYGYTVQTLVYTLKFKKEEKPATAYYVSKDGKVVHLGSVNTVEGFVKDLEN